MRQENTMNSFKSFVAACAFSASFSVAAAEVTPTPTELACSDFKPTPAAAERFDYLKGACEAIVDINGHTYARFRAIVRRATSSSVTINLPATDRTYTVRPGPDLRVLVGSEKVRPRDLMRGQEIRIYLSTDEFAKPNVTELSFVESTETGVIPVPMPAEPERALPTTASVLPAVGLLGGVLILAGALMWLTPRRRADVR
jgi:hypothetical protein